MLVSVDTGGTFTDFIYDDNGNIKIHKRLSTPDDPSRAVIEGLRSILGEEKADLIHGSTVATNAILEGKGSRTILITNKGFEDVIEIGRQNRHKLYDLNYKRQKHLVPSERRFGIDGRIMPDGKILEPLNEEEIERLANKLSKMNVESIAITLLYSFLYKDHEKRVGEILSRTGLPLSISHEIMSEFREFERTSTTVVNAYVMPIMKKYISRLEGAGEIVKLSIMQSNGGRISSSTAMKEPVRTILSGPAGGAVGAFEIGKKAGFNKLITFDMGGTSTDVSLMEGGLPFSVEAGIASYPLKVPMIEIHTVGAGGGSIARLDDGNALKVGPESAGADPGPICYGKGKEITVTDANLLLGRLIPENFLGGDMSLDIESVRKAFERLSEKTGISPVELAQGICTIANTEMERAIRVISVERGFDPGEFTLVSFGGAGGLHAMFLAQLLNIPKVLIPKNPGILSAMGMLLADIIKDYSLTVMLENKETDYMNLSSQFEDLEERALTEMSIEGIEKEEVIMEYYLDMRYSGQSYELIVPFDREYERNFHIAHEKRYGYKNEGKPIEIVNLRLKARGLLDKEQLEEILEPTSEIPSDAYIGIKEVVFDSAVHKAKLYQREKLKYGNVITGPAIIAEYSSTTVLPPKTSTRVDSYENLVVELEGVERNED